MGLIQNHKTHRNIFYQKIILTNLIPLHFCVVPKPDLDVNRPFAHSGFNPKIWAKLKNIFRCFYISYFPYSGKKVPGSCNLEQWKGAFE